MLYLDASALVKRYIEEEGSDAVEEAMDGDLTFATWDVRLHSVAQDKGFRTLPAALG